LRDLNRTEIMVQVEEQGIPYFPLYLTSEKKNSGKKFFNWLNTQFL
jgi:hypothetical protein